MLYGRSKPELEQLGAEFTGLFTNADGNLFAETYNQLNAYFATVPGNYALNLRKLYLLNTNYADLSFLFTILPGEKTNAHLGTEYLAVLETDNSTPYYLNLHTGDVAHTLILGMSGSGKSYLCVFLLQNAQKYEPLTFIFDIGGSFQSLTTISIAPSVALAHLWAECHGIRNSDSDSSQFAGCLCLDPNPFRSEQASKGIGPPSGGSRGASQRRQSCDSRFRCAANRHRSGRQSRAGAQRANSAAVVGNSETDFDYHET